MKEKLKSTLNWPESILTTYKYEMTKKQFRWGLKALRKVGILNPEYISHLKSNLETARTTGELLSFLHSNKILNQDTLEIVAANLEHSKRLLKSCKLLIDSKKLDIDNFKIISSCAVRSQVLIEYLTLFSDKGLKQSSYWLFRNKFKFELNIIFVECIIYLANVGHLTLENFNKLASHPNIISLYNAFYKFKKSNLLTQKNLDYIFNYDGDVHDLAKLIISLSQKSWCYEFVNNLLGQPKSCMGDLGSAISELAQYSSFEQAHVLFITSLKERKAYIAKAMVILLLHRIYTPEIENFLLAISVNAKGNYSSNNFEKVERSPEHQVAQLLCLLNSVGFINNHNLELLLNSSDSFTSTFFSTIRSCCQYLISANLFTQEKFELLCHYHAEKNSDLISVSGALDELNNRNLLTESNFQLVMANAQYSNNLWLTNTSFEKFYRTQSDFELLISHAPYATKLLKAFSCLHDTGLLENSKLQLCSLGNKTHSTCLAIINLYENRALNQNHLDQLFFHSHTISGFTAAVSLIGWQKSIDLVNAILEKMFSKPEAAFIVAFENDHHRSDTAVSKSFINIKRSARILARGYSTIGSSIFQFPADLLKIITQKTAIDNTLSQKEAECIANYYFK